ncbi:hypothetical protein FACS1894164_00230 [Spirochaetia bacterium]|nr:hypothetical protein FACS1894164_00230 [Spirochaetia bacterium]
MGRVIHVDNSGFFRRLFRHFLATRDIDSEDFDRGSQAFESIGRGGVPLIITGMFLVDMTGLDLIKQLTASPYRNIPIITLSSNTAPDMQQALHDLGVTAQLSKYGPWREEVIPYLDKYISLSRR